MDRRAGLWTLAAAAGLIGAVWAVTLERLAFERERAIAHAVRENDNLALALEAHTLRAIRAADQLLVFLRHQYTEHGEIVEPEFMREAGLMDESLVPNYLVVDAKGRVLKADGTPGEANVADQEYFVFHRNEPRAGLFISRPFVGRFTRKTLLSLSRRMSAADGGFRGLVAVGLDVEHFLNTYRSLSLGPRGMVQVLGQDGIVRFRRIGAEASTGQDMKGSKLLELAAAAPVGNFVSDGNRFDGHPRYQSYRRLEPYGLVLTVGRAEGDVLAEFEDHRRDYFAGAAAGTFLVLLFAAGLLFVQARRARVEAANQALQARYRAAFEAAPIGVAHFDIEGRFLAVNPKCCAMLGYAAEELVGRSARELTHPQDVTAGEELRRRLLAVQNGDPAPEIEKRYLRKDGSVLWALVSAALVRGEGGAAPYVVSLLRDITVRKAQESRLLAQIDELRRFQKVTVERELRMIELEGEIRELRRRAAA